MPIFRERELSFMLEFAQAKLLVVPHRFRGFDYPAMLAGLRGKLPHLQRVLAVGDDGPDGFDRVLLETRWEDQFDAEAEFARRRPDPNAVIQLLYTSGTTGPAKGVVCPHAQYHGWGANTARILDLGPDDVLATTLPLFHINALNTFAQASLTGGEVVFLPRFSASGFWPAMQACGATVVYLLGAMVPILLSREAEAAWNNSATKVTLLQDGKAFKSYLQDNPDQFTELEKEVIRKFQKAADTGFSSLLITAGEYSTFHRLFVDPVTRAMFSSRGTDFAFMQEAKKVGATSEEAAYLLAEKLYPQELEELETWYTAA